MKKIITSIDEFTAAEAPVKQPKPDIETAPSTPGKPDKTRFPKPSYDPKPKAKAVTEEDIVEVFIEELKRQDRNVPVNVKKLRK